MTKKYAYLTVVPSEKFEYLNNRRKFFYAGCVKIHKTLPSTSNLNFSKICRHRLKKFGRGLPEPALIT